MDPALPCPVCEYDLSGLPENRCPECGSAFTPDDVRSGAGGEPSIEVTVDLVGLMCGVFGAAFSVMSCIVKDGRVLVLATWFCVLFGARLLHRRGPCRQWCCGLLLVLPMPTLLTALSPVPRVCAYWAATAIALAGGLWMLMRPARRSAAVAGVAAVSVTCLTVGFAYLYADSGYWAQRFQWSNAFVVSTAGGSRPGTAAEFVLLGAALAIAGVVGLFSIVVAGDRAGSGE
ncbi:MAG: hypothetical protein KF745_08670 [Phycisphaeraceae bacterium]|nr:hypothetical protein [Phycisphaeraceae bacterium]